MQKSESSSVDANSSPKSTALSRLYRKLSPKRSPTHQHSPINSASSSSSELLRVFNYLDGNGDGKISAGELQKCVRTVGGEAELSAEDAEAAVLSSDVDGDGLLGFEDFKKLMEGSNSEEDLRRAFGMYETEPGSGFISPSSLKRMLSRLGDNSTSLLDCTRIIRTFDSNADGLLTFHDFSLMMR